MRSYYRQSSSSLIGYNLYLFGKVMVQLPNMSSERVRNYEALVDFIRELRLSIVLLLFAISVGVIGYMLIEGFNLMDAYYMTIITLSTVGFTEVHPLSSVGRIFTTLLILFNLGIFTFAISTLSVLFAKGNLSKILTEVQMIEKIRKLEKHHIICGFGRHGQEVAREFRKQNMPFIVVENNKQKLMMVRDETDYLYIDGDATNDDLLLEAGIKVAQSIILTLPNDAENLFAITSAKQLNDRIKIISRSSSPRDEVKLKRAGADYVILPERLGGFYMASLVKNPDLVEFFTLVSNLEGSNAVFEELGCDKLPNDVIGKSIGECTLFRDNSIQVLAVKTADGKYILNPDQNSTFLHRDMDIVLFGKVERIKSL